MLVHIRSADNPSIGNNEFLWGLLAVVELKLLQSTQGETAVQVQGAEDDRVCGRCHIGLFDGPSYEQADRCGFGGKFGRIPSSRK
jgi:hypothetical protein